MRPLAVCRGNRTPVSASLNKDFKSINPLFFYFARKLEIHRFFLWVEPEISNQSSLKIRKALSFLQNPTKNGIVIL